MAATIATTIAGITPNNDIAVVTAAALESKDLPAAVPPGAVPPGAVLAASEEPDAVDPPGVEVLDTAVKATRR